MVVNDAVIFASSNTSVFVVSVVAVVLTNITAVVGVIVVTDYVSPGAGGDTAAVVITVVTINIAGNTDDVNINSFILLMLLLFLLIR